MGHAFEARIYAENPRNNFLPDSGPLFYLSTPTPTHVFAPALPATTPAEGAPKFTPPLIVNSSSSGDIEPSVRLEQGFGQGSQIGVFYDPMIAKLVVHGRDRTEALRVLRKALDEYKVVGVATNVEFLRILAGNEAFIRGDVETGFIPVSICPPPSRSFILIPWICLETLQRLVPAGSRANARSACTDRSVRGPPGPSHRCPVFFTLDLSRLPPIWRRRLRSFGHPANRGRVPDLYRPGQVHFPWHLRYHCERQYGIHLCPCTSRLQGRGFQFCGWQKPTDNRRLATSTSLAPGVFFSEHDGAVTCLPGRAEVYTGPPNPEVVVVPWRRCVGGG